MRRASERSACFLSVARAARICVFFGARMLAALRGGGIPPLRKEGGGDVPAESGEAAFQLNEKDGGVQDRPNKKERNLPCLFALLRVALQKRRILFLYREDCRLS